MELKALSAGVGALAERGRGRVHSVFAGACVVELPDDRIFTLLAARLCNVPHGIRLATPGAYFFSDHCRPGDAVTIRSEMIRVGGNALIVDLTSAAPWDGDISKVCTDMRNDASTRAWAAGWDQLGSMVPYHGEVPLPYWVATREGLIGLINAAACLELDAARAATNVLVGLGPGLTPAGDDVLVGLLAGLWATAGLNSERLRFVRLLGDAATSHADATTLVSRAYLAAAVRGQVSEPILGLARAIAAGEPPQTARAAVRSMSRIGATSGFDGALGLLAGLTVWHGPARTRVLDRLASPRRRAA